MKAAAREIDNRHDKMVFAAIYQSVSKQTLLLLTEKKTTKEAWAALKTMYVGADRVLKAKLQTVKTEFDGLQRRDGESVDEFAIRITTVLSKMHTLGAKIEDSYVVEKVLHVVTPRFLPVASNMEQSRNLETMLLEEVYVWAVESV